MAIALEVTAMSMSVVVCYMLPAGTTQVIAAVCRCCGGRTRVERSARLGDLEWLEANIYKYGSKFQYPLLPWMIIGCIWISYFKIFVIYYYYYSTRTLSFLHLFLSLLGSWLLKELRRFHDDDVAQPTAIIGVSWQSPMLV